MGDTQRPDASDIARLIKASQKGDRAAFDEVVRLYQQRAMQVAIRALGDANEAAEAVQNSFIKAYVNIGKLKQPKRFEVWLMRIVINAAISQKRATGRKTKAIKVPYCYKSKKITSPLDKQIGDELKEAIQQAMLKLSEKENKAIALFGLRGLSHKEVAQIMDCSVEAVRWHVFRARQKLRALLREYLE